MLQNPLPEPMAIGFGFFDGRCAGSLKVIFDSFYLLQGLIGRAGLTTYLPADQQPQSQTDPKVAKFVSLVPDSCNIKRAAEKNYKKQEPVK